MNGPAGFASLARFRLLRELGRGAQARVWLAHDPRLDREVALKLLDTTVDPEAVHQWLQEARAVSRLNHPHIVPVFEADEHDGQPYLVFEFVDGPTLAQARRGKPPLPACEAATLMLGVLDALAAAHEQGIVHRDLKPSNVLLGADGRARVMDFGIAARVGQAGNTPADGRIVGTPGYMSPEAARGAAPVPAMDVFAAGAMLGELLCGAPLLRETDPQRAVRRIQREDLLLPTATPVDATLRGIVQRAVARETAARYDGARSLHSALAEWLQQQRVTSAVAAPADTGGTHATLEFLLRRMRHKTDFPALSASVVSIQRVATSETESLRSLTDEILKDVALTNKLLRMVNTAQFTAVSGGGIATVSRAVALVGFAGVRNMALSVVLLEHMNDKAHAAQLREEFLRALMAGTLADQLAPTARVGEEAFLGAMFQNLGRMLTECYFPEEAVQIRQQVGAATGPAAAVEREAASRRVLGIGFDELGAGVARAWGLPDALQRVSRTPSGSVPSRPIETRAADRGIERMRWIGRGANAIADALLAGDGQAQADALATAAELYAPVLGMSARDIAGAAQTARSRLSQLAQAMGLQVQPGVPARRLLLNGVDAPLPAAALAASAACGAAAGAAGGAAGASAAGPTPGMAPGPAANAYDRTLVLPVAAADGAGSPLHVDAAATGRAELTQALADVRHATAGKVLRLNEVLHRVLDTLHRALQFRYVVLCLREAGCSRLVGRVGLGAGASDIAADFRIKPDAHVTSDLFGWICARGSDLLIADSRTVLARLPAWYRQRVNAPTFLLLPVMLKGAPIGLIYADKAQAGAIQLPPAELELVRALRDEAAAAFARGQP